MKISHHVKYYIFPAGKMVASGVGGLVGDE